MYGFNALSTKVNLIQTSLQKCQTSVEQTNVKLEKLETTLFAIASSRNSAQTEAEKRLREDLKKERRMLEIAIIQKCEENLGKYIRDRCDKQEKDLNRVYTDLSDRIEGITVQAARTDTREDEQDPHHMDNESSVDQKAR